MHHCCIPKTYYQYCNIQYTNIQTSKYFDISTSLYFIVTTNHYLGVVGSYMLE